MFELVWTDFAVSELKNIYFYYRFVAGEKVAQSIRSKILDATAKLTEHPEIGATETTLVELGQKHRYLVVGNYKVIYLVMNKTVFITDIFDGRQSPKKIKRGLRN